MPDPFSELDAILAEINASLHTEMPEAQRSALLARLEQVQSQLETMTDEE